MQAMNLGRESSVLMLARALLLVIAGEILTHTYHVQAVF